MKKRALSLLLALALCAGLTLPASAAQVVYQGKTYTYNDALAQDETFLTNLNALVTAAEKYGYSANLFDLFFQDVARLSEDTFQFQFYYTKDGNAYTTSSWTLKVPGAQEAYDDIIRRYERGDIDSSQLSAEMAEFSMTYHEMGEQMRLDEEMQEFAHEHGMDLTTAQVEFDPATGTILKVLSDEPILTIPSTINGVTVTAMAEGAVSGKTKLNTVILPITIHYLDRVVFRDCPNLEYIDSSATWLVKPYQNCPSLSEEDPGNYTPMGEEHYTTVLNYDYYAPLKSTKGPTTYKISETFAVASGTLRGDGKGLNWDGTLTRAEAITIIIRLMGLEEEAKARMNDAPAFTDVMATSAWANGYVNLAKELGVTGGVGGGRFDPTGLCTAQDFLTMLFRLTNLTEGKDYAWSTALLDFRDALLAIEDIPWLEPGIGYWQQSFIPDYVADAVVDYLNHDGPFTRLVATDLLYCMLNIDAGASHESLADILAAEYGLSDHVIYNNFIRRTAYGNDALIGKSDLSNFAHAQLYTDETYSEQESSASIPTEQQEQFREAIVLAQELTRGCTTEYEKAKVISQWVSEHIFYDYDNFLHDIPGPTVADEVLRERRSVCAGYASLTSIMLRAVGIQTTYESGYASGDRHAWNRAKVDGRWVVIDNTWDSPLKYEHGNYYLSQEDRETGRTVRNVQEPGAKWDTYYFDGDIHNFYQSHVLEPNPWEGLVINGTTGDPLRVLQSK